MQKPYHASAYSHPTIAGDLNSLLFALQELGIGLWELDLKTNTVLWVKASMTHAITPGSDGLYDVEYTAIDRKNGRERILHAQGKAVADKNGVAYKMNGTAQDVTEQRRTQQALEQQVRERTEELADSNKNLSETNEELANSNDRLLLSNEQLAQYAYVASHDLQEPLRKIRIFSGLLSAQTDLSENNIRLVEKISRSSERMSMLIENLLDFSRLLNAEEIQQPVYPGTGIGLALCRRIVANQRGHLYATSVPGIGTTFPIILPEHGHHGHQPDKDQTAGNSLGQIVPGSMDEGVRMDNN